MIAKFALWCALVSIAAVSAVSVSQPGRDAYGQSLLSAFVAYADLRIGSVQQTVRVLSCTTEVTSGEWKNMEALLASYQKSDAALVAWFALPDGTYYTGDKGLMDVSLSDRAYFPDLMAGREVTAFLVVSKSTGQRSAVIAVPVKQGGKVVGAIGTSLFLDKFSEQIASALSLPKDASFFALAPDGRTTLHKQADRHFLDPRELGSDSLKTAVNQMLSRTSGEVSYEFDNAAKTAIYRTSPLTQWRFAITLSAASQK